MAASLNGLLPGIVGAAYRRRGFAEPALVTGWRAVVGDQAADCALPVKIVFPRGSRTGGTLHVRVEGAYALELQHNAPRIVERLNAFYGYAAIARLALHQGPVETTGPMVEEPPGPRTRTVPEIVGIGDPQLREALRGLGTAIRASSASEPPEQGGPDDSVRSTRARPR